MADNFSINLHGALGYALQAADSIRNLEFDICHHIQAAANLRRARASLRGALNDLDTFEAEFLKSEPAKAEG